MKNKIVLFDIDYTLFDTDLFKSSKLRKHSLYKEVLEVLRKLSPVATLGIFSEGKNDFQREKLIKTKIMNFFLEKHIYIFDAKEMSLKGVIDKYKNHELFLVDDKLTILHQAKRVSSNIVTIWLKRGMYAENQLPIEGCKPDDIIENLTELVPIVLKK